MTKAVDRPSEREFLRNVKAHEMTVLRDEGVDRHLRFKAPNTSNQYFDLITWRGSLCFTGDMGTFVFSRIPDMFEFFRDEQCNARCQQYVDDCYAQGYSLSVCSHVGIQCSSDCLYGVCSR